MDIINKITIKEEHIDDLMVTALEGGINYWCSDVFIIDNPNKCSFASEVVAYGGEIKLITFEGVEFKLNRDLVVQGIKKAMEHFEYDSFNNLMNEHDAITADVIIQFTLFDKIVFG